MHVATPLEVCEQRDQEGLCAKAQVRVITEFTGISALDAEPADSLERATSPAVTSPYSAAFRPRGCPGQASTPAVSLSRLAAHRRPVRIEWVYDC